MQNYTDSELVTFYKETHQPEYLEELFLRHSPLMYRTAYHIMKQASDAEDILQIVCCKMITDLKDYKGSGSLVSWILQIVVHTCYNQKKAEKNRRNRDQKFSSESILVVKPKDYELEEVLDNHLNNLPEIYKTPIILQIMEGLSVKEVSVILKLPEKTIRTQISRGLNKLKTSLKHVGITASVTLIAVSLKKIPPLNVPEIRDMRVFFRSQIKKCRVASTSRVAIQIESKKTINLKLISMALLVSVIFATIIIWHNASIVINKSDKNSKLEWDFENISNIDEYKSIGLISGAMAIIDSKGQDSSRCLEVEENTSIEIDISNIELPILVTYQVDISRNDILKKNIMFTDFGSFSGKKRPLFSNLFDEKSLALKQSKFDKNKENWFQQAVYIDDNSFDCWVNGKRSHLLLEADVNKAKLIFSFQTKILVDNLVIKSISREEMPDKYLYKTVASKYAYNPEFESYEIEKSKLGFNHQAKVNPKLSFVSADQDIKGWTRKDEEKKFAHIDKHNKITWSVIFR